MKEITTVIINYQTPALLQVAVSSFKGFYPDTKLILIDNGSKDEEKSKKVIEELGVKYSAIEVIYLEKNIYHGPAMDLAIRKYIKTDYTFFLDSDTESIKPDFLERMLEMSLLSDKIYGVGELAKVNNRGYKSEEGNDILLTPYMLIKNEIYTDLKPFVHHGQPTLFNFIDAKEKGYLLKKFEVSTYIDHLWRGTASKFGYGLGLKGKIGYVLNRLGL